MTSSTTPRTNPGRPAPGTRSRVLAGAGLGLALVSGGVLAAGAPHWTGVSDAGQGSDTASVSADATSDFTTDAQAIAYWTPARRAEAARNAAVAAAQAAAQPHYASQLAETPEGYSPSSSDAAGASSGLDVLARPAATSGSTAHAMGALFFTLNGKSMMCSASSMWTASRNVVLSAGHCVYDNKTKQWAKNMTFVPAYQGLSANWAPYGVWRAKKMHTFPTWISKGDFSRDVSFTSFLKGGSLGDSVANTVGGEGIWYGGSYAWSGYMFGYPSNKPNGSKVLQACKASVKPYGAEEAVVGCYFGHGASGGPWVYRYNGTTKLGYVRSVSSYITLTSAKYDFGPYFDKYVYAMLGQANADK